MTINDLNRIRDRLRMAEAKCPSCDLHDDLAECICGSLTNKIEWYVPDVKELIDAIDGILYQIDKISRKIDSVAERIGF